jgi:hypothetical protein
MRVLVCGGRTYSSKSSVFSVLGKYEHEITMIIHGDARGADTLAKEWAIEKKVPYLTVPANWDEYGFEAGPIRNSLMLELGNPELVIAFPGGKGTANMVKQSRKRNIEVIEFYD